MANRQLVEEYLQHPNMRNFLDVLAFAEGTQKHGYHTTFGGGRIDDLSQHPNKIWGRTGDGATTATGRYQFLGSTWNEQAKKLGLKDFSGPSQDLAAVSLIADRGAAKDIINGDINSALKKLSSTWASLPYNNSPHQSQRKLGEVMNYWNNLKNGKEQGLVMVEGNANGQPREEVGMSQPTTPFDYGFTPPVNMQNTTPSKTENGTDFAGFNQLNNILNDFVEPQPPKVDYRQQFQQQLASAFGIEPKASNGIPDYIGDLVRSIYDETA